MAGVALVAAIVSFIITHSIAKSLAGAQEVGGLLLLRADVLSRGSETWIPLSAWF